MARKKPVISFSASLEVEAAAPLDARTVVPTKADLTTASNFPYAYAGLTVYVEEEQKNYTLTADDVTVLANWKEVGSGSGSGGQDNVIETVKVNGTSLVPDANKAVDVPVPDFHTLNSSAIIEQTKNDTTHRLSVDLEDNTNKIAVHIWNGSSEKQWHAETEQSLRRDALVGATPDLSMPNGAVFVTTSEPDPLSLNYVVMDNNDAWTGVRVTDTSPFIFNRKGTSVELCRLTVTESSPGEWEVSAYDGSFDPKTWNFFTENPVVPRVQSWLNLSNYYNKTETDALLDDYEVCVNDVGGNVVKIGSIAEGANTYGLYQFYYRTGALPAADSAVIYPCATLLADFTIETFLDATGVTDQGIFIGNGRTDNNNRLIVQQFSKVNKNIHIRAYQNFSSQTALLKVIFMGTKN